jgi:hypothetical protein
VIRLLLLLMFVGCGGGYSVNVDVELLHTDAAGSVTMTDAGGTSQNCGTNCAMHRETVGFTLLPVPEAGSVFVDWDCSGNKLFDNPLIIADGEAYARLLHPNNSGLDCTARFSVSLATICADAIGVAAQSDQQGDYSSLGFLPEIVSGGNATGLVVADRCDADTYAVTVHSSTAVPAKAPEPTTNTVIQAAQLVEHDQAVTLDCDAPEWVAGECAEQQTQLYFWIIIEDESVPPGRARALAPNDQLQFSIVFDSDGSPANNYVPSPQYPSDFWRGTDTQFAANYANGIWTLRKTVGPSLTPMPTNATLFAHGSTLLWAVPASEAGIVDGDIPAGFGYRTSLFRHGGDYGINPPHDWSGDVDPPVDQPLYSLP